VVARAELKLGATKHWRIVQNSRHFGDASQSNPPHTTLQSEVQSFVEGRLSAEEILLGQPQSITVPTVKVEGARGCPADDLLAVEEALEIRLGERSLSITMRTPGNDFELAAGFLFAEGIVRQRADIRSLERPPDGATDIVAVELSEGAGQAQVRAERNFLMTSACGVCGKASLRDLAVNACPILPPDDIRLAPEIIYLLPRKLREAQSVFESTGGLHAAARFNLQGVLESVLEDVGRHNAVDKLIGAGLLERQVPMSQSVLLVSGGASFELVQKALVASIPVMCAVGAPSSLAVATAERAGMTLIGFLRNERFNIYTRPDRIFGLERSTWANTFAMRTSTFHPSAVSTLGKSNSSGCVLGRAGAAYFRRRPLVRKRHSMEPAMVAVFLRVGARRGRAADHRRLHHSRLHGHGHGARRVHFHHSRRGDRRVGRMHHRRWYDQVRGKAPEKSGGA